MSWIYLFVNLPFFWKCKIGISRNVGNRRKQVNQSTPGVVLKVWAVYVPLAESTEQTLHGFFKPFHSPFRSGSGKSEWFYLFPTLPLAWLILNFMFLVWWSPVWVPLVWLWSLIS